VRIPFAGLAFVLGFTGAVWIGCASESLPSSDHYLRYSAFDTGFNEHILMRWPDQRMPLKVHLPAPPPGMVEDPEAVLEAVRDGFTDWTDAAGPGVPSFVFVEEAGAADIPVVWEAAPNGEWYIAHCAYDLDFRPVRFGVSRILITTEWEGATWSLQDLYETLLHEVGHSLGLRHSPNRADIMFAGKADARGLSERDRGTLRRLYSLPIGHRVAGARTADR
jgi:predicted Zn-dependent protease